jgi:putative transposase
VNRSPLFHEDEDYVCLLDLIALISADCALAVHAHILMTNHFHLLVTPEHERSLPHAMKRICGQYAHYFNRKYGRIGPICNGRYRGRLIADERYWLTCLRYIEQNPVRAHMVTSPAEYPWSSYRAHGLGETIPWLSEHYLYSRLGATQSARLAAYRAICAIPLDESELALQRRPPKQKTRIKPPVSVAEFALSDRPQLESVAPSQSRELPAR